MSVFQDIIKGMADGAETLQANFAKLAKAISAIDDDGTIHFGSVSADNLAVKGTPIMKRLFTGNVSYNQTGTLNMPKSNFDYLIVQMNLGGNTSSTYVTASDSSFIVNASNMQNNGGDMYFFEVNVSMTDTSFTMNGTNQSTVKGAIANSFMTGASGFSITSIIGVTVA